MKQDVDKRQITSKIAAIIPLAIILDDIWYNISSNNFERLHLIINKKDLHNIEQAYNLTSSVRHKDDAVSVKAWIIEVQDSNCVLFYKPRKI